jgi:acyl-CoA dehydrogenase
MTSTTARAPQLSVDDLGFAFAKHHAEVATRVRAVLATIESIEESTEEHDARDRAIVAALGAAGFLKLFAPDGAIDLRSIALVREGLAWTSGNADALFAVQGLGTYPIHAFGTNEQKNELLGDAVSGAAVAAFALTEPEAGTDVASLQTSASRDGARWRLDGTKVFISNAPIAERLVVFANADPSKGRKGITAFVVRRGAPGLSIDGPTPLVAEHSIGTVHLRGCVVDDGDRLGEVGQGFAVAMGTLDTFRVTVGAAACGMARRALDEATHRAATRKQFGGAIGELQQIQAYLADSLAELDAARLLVARAARKRDEEDVGITREAAIAKMFATEAAQRIIDRAVQIHGGQGVVRGNAVERLYREIRALRIYEGTTEIQKVVIAKGMLSDERARLDRQK